MLVQISDKEQSRIQSAKQYYTSQGLEVEVTNLEIGDYVFDNQVAFEFKTIADFITSINDNRVFNEAINQAETFDHHFVIIYGDLFERSKQIAISRNYREINLYQYIGAINSLNRYTTVIQVYNPTIEEAYYTMMNQARKCLQNKPIVKKFNRKHKNAAMNWLCYCVYGLNAKRAKDIVTMLDLHTLEDLFNVTHQQLTSVDGIGVKLADKIIETLDNDAYES